MRFRIATLVIASALVGSAAPRPMCPVTQATTSPFLYGTPELSAFIRTQWRLHVDGTKLPYFSSDLDPSIDSDPPMTVIATRLDAPSSPVVAKRINIGRAAGIFMVTSLEIPAAGCWEIKAVFTPRPDKVRTLAYTVRVEP